MSTSKFAKKQLTKHGWKEGSGLGREEAGIKEAIKVKIKTDTAGIGHNQGDEFTFHWWDHVFNKAAGSISVQNSEEGVALKKTADNGPISNKKTKTFDNKSMLYGKFVKAATLSDGNYKPQNDNVEESSDSEKEGEKIRNRIVSDKMLDMCDGMTAHKAARHGHKLNGKLIRVQEQERILLESMKKTLKKESLSKTDHTESDEELEDSQGLQTDNIQKKKKKKKQRKSRLSEDFDKSEIVTDTSELINLDSEHLRKKKKKRKIMEEDEIDNITSAENCNARLSGRKKKKKVVDNDEKGTVETVSPCSKEIDSNIHTGNKIKKKKKRKKSKYTD